MESEDHLYSGVIGRVQWFARRFGWGEIVCLPFRILASRIVVPFLRERHFKFRDGLLPCFYAHYNVTWCNERAVEVPLGRWYLEQAAEEADRQTPPRFEAPRRQKGRTQKNNNDDRYC